MFTAGRFLWSTCILLVTVLTGVVLWEGSKGGPLYATGLVKGPGSSGSSNGSSSGTASGSATKSSSTEQVPLQSNLVEAVTGPHHELDPVLALARRALARFRSEVDDYTGVIVKRERIAGALGGETRMEMKIRTRRMEGEKLVRPIQVYLKMLDPWLARGREVIWVENRNEGKLVAHEGGLKNLVRVNLLPNDQLAMMGNKYPITEIGLEKLIEKLIEKGERDKLAGPCTVKTTEGFEVGGRPCLKIEVIHPNIDPRFDFHIAEIFMDTERLIPLRYAAFMWPPKPGDPPVLEEEYTYTDIRLNVGLKDSDFDPSNPSYKFP